MAPLGGGAMLAGLVLGAIAAFIIDREFKSATIFALAGAVLSFFGFIHGAAARHRHLAAGRARLLDHCRLLLRTQQAGLRGSDDFT